MSDFIRIQFSQSEKDFLLKSVKCTNEAVLSKIREAAPLAKLRSYRECFLTEGEFQDLAGAIRYEAKNNKKKAIATVAQELLETFHSIWDARKRE